MANAITIGRLVLLFVTVALLYTRSYPVVVACIALIIVVFASDWLDGFVARRWGSPSAFGALLDIAGDRVVENTLWVVYAHLGLIGVWAPLVVLTRGFLVDAMRSVAYGAGKTAFGETTMMRSPVTRFLTASRFMRAWYGAAKALGFVFLAGLFGARLERGTALADLYGSEPLRLLGWLMVYSALALTIVRGVPVLIDARYYLTPPSTETR